MRTFWSWLCTIGFSSHAGELANLLEQARMVCCFTQQKARSFNDIYYNNYLTQVLIG